MSRECLACRISHDPKPETCASCGELQYPDAWFHVTPTQWDPICSNCFGVVLESSHTGLKLSQALQELVAGE